MPVFYSFLFTRIIMQGGQLRVMLDTNTYEFLLKNGFSKVKALVKKGNLVVYGCKIIRDEFRDIPPSVKYDGKSFRNLLLQVYDGLVKDHSFPIERVVDVLAEEYWKEYKGGVPKRKIMPDFLIVATATIHTLYIIVSEDDRTMKSKPCLRAYNKVNEKNGLNTPRFIRLNELSL